MFDLHRSWSILKSKQKHLSLKIFSNGVRRCLQLEKLPYTRAGMLRRVVVGTVQGPLCVCCKIDGRRSFNELLGLSEKFASVSVLSNFCRIVCESEDETACVLDRRGCRWKSKWLCVHLSFVSSTSIFTDGIQIVVVMQRPCSV